MSDLEITSRGQDQLVFGRTNDAAGETTFEVELNRAQDFQSDISLFLPGQTSSIMTFTSLPAGTTWFARSRSTNLAEPGPWSNVEIAATLPATAPADYTGFSIEPAELVIPVPIMNLTTSDTMDLPVSNLLRDDPQSACARFHISDRGFDIRFTTSGEEIDRIALLGTMCCEGEDWTIRASDDPDDPLDPSADFFQDYIDFRVSDGLGPRPGYHGYYSFDTPVTYRFWRIAVRHHEPQFVARNLVLGKARRSDNYDRGASIEPMDLSQVDRTILGTPNVTQGHRGRKASFALSWLDEDEYEAKWGDLEWRAGNSTPVLAVMNSKANRYMQDRMVFGKISSMRGEHVRGRKYLREIEIDSIY